MPLYISGQRLGTVSATAPQSFKEKSHGFCPMNGGPRAAVAAPTCALVALLLLAGPASAADSEFELEAALPITVDGAHTLRLDDAAFYAHGGEGQMGLLLSDAEGVLKRVIHRAYPVVETGDPELQWKQEVRVEELPLRKSIVQIQERRDDFQIYIHDTDFELAEGPRGGALHVGALDLDKAVKNQLQEPLRLSLLASESRPFHDTLRAGLYQGHATDGRLTAADGYRIFLSDAVVQHIDGAGQGVALPAHFRVEQQPGGIYDPIHEEWTGIGHHTEYVDEYLVLEGTGLLQVQFAGVTGQTFSRDATADVEGDVLIPDATGTVSVHTEDGHDLHTADSEDVQLAGRFTMAMTGMSQDRAHTNIQGSGDITRVSLDGETHEYPWAAVAAIGLGTLALAALAWAFQSGKLALGGGLLTGYARVQGQDVLDHPGRTEVYHLVQANPGANFHELEKKVDFGASTLNYHLRVLERNQFVSRVKDGRYVRFFDRQSGHYSRHRKDAACALRNDTTAKIAAHIAQNPGAAQCDLAQRFGIAASTVSWHIRRLQENGLVMMQRDNHFTRYYLGEAWTSLPDVERQRHGVLAAVA